jgi:hypothetical protein
MPLQLLDIEGASLVACDRNGGDWVLKLSTRIFSTDAEEAIPTKAAVRFRGVELISGDWAKVPLPKDIIEFDLQLGTVFWTVHLPPDFRHEGEMQVRLKLGEDLELRFKATELALALAQPAPVAS